MTQLAFEKPHAGLSLDQVEWTPIQADPRGLVNISRVVSRSGMEPQTVLALTIIKCAQLKVLRLRLGYSDFVTVYLNGQPKSG